MSKELKVGTDALREAALDLKAAAGKVGVLHVPAHPMPFAPALDAVLAAVTAAVNTTSKQIAAHLADNAAKLVAAADDYDVADQTNSGRITNI